MTETLDKALGSFSGLGSFEFLTEGSDREGGLLVVGEGSFEGVSEVVHCLVWSGDK